MYIYMSLTWTTRTSAANNAWTSVTYGNGLFVAVASSGTGDRVMTSPDGITWTSRTSAADNDWRGVTYGNGLFVAVAASGTGNRVMTSPDGITWTTRTSAADNNWNSVTYGNGLFVAVAASGTGNRVMTSPDGITWTSRTSDNGNWNSVTYGNGLFVAVGGQQTQFQVMTSSDGINWTTRIAVFNNWLGVTYGNGLFVAVASSGSAGNQVMTSPDGIIWTRRPSFFIICSGVTYGNGLFVAISTRNFFMTSPDGITWSVGTPANDNPLVSVSYENGLFVAVSDKGNNNRVMTAPSSPTITNFSIPTKTYDDVPFTITPPTSNSSGSFSYTSSNLSVATISGNTITIVGVGVSTITANQAETTNYTSGTITTTFQVNKSSPTITNFSIPTKTYGDTAFTITPPTSNSSGSFSYTSSNLSVATISGNTITIVGAGVSTITANQASTTNYTSGTITTIFQVKLTPTITNFFIPTKIYGDVPFTITQPTSDSSGSFSYTSSNLSVATISGNTITIVGVGESTITANQAETTNYTSGTMTTPFYVAVIVADSIEFLNFMDTTATVGYITNNLEINDDLLASSYKVLIGDNITITKSNN
jgi:hypothetical protein